MKQIISTSHAPGAIGPYSQAIRVGNFVFCSGQTPLVPETGKLVEGDIVAQTHQVLENLKAVLASAGLGLEHVVKTTLFIRDMSQFATINQAYAEYFPTNPPARSTVEVSRLPRDAAIEIELVAYAGE